jgi:toxin ParE1/3/4
VSYSFTRRARQELSDALDWYLEDGGPAPAEMFENTVHRALRLLAAMPGLGTRSYPGVRTWPLKDFPYTLVYREQESGIKVIAVAHQSRRPGYWVGR